MQAWYKRRKKRPVRERSPHTVLVRQFIVGLVLFATFALLGAGIWYGTRIDRLTISTITVEGGMTIPHDEVRRITEQELTDSYFKLVPRRFGWTYPKDAIERAIRANGRVKDVELARSGTELHIAFTEHEPAWLWCATLSARPCAFLDRDGYAFSMAPMITGASFVRYVDPVRPPRAGEHAFPAADAGTFRAFVDGMRDRFDFAVTGIEQLAPGEAAFHLAHDGIVKTTLAIPIEETLANLETILSSPQFEHLRTAPFAYIDLRYGNKIFVMEQHAEVSVEPETERETAAPEGTAE